jgi:exonuclease III
VFWNILCWNIRGLNASGKWDVVRNKLEESACSIVCLQETKRDHFDIAFIRNFALRRFDCFDFIPADGASGGCSLCGLVLVFVAPLRRKGSTA